MIIELRQYTLHLGKRDTLIDLFDREFIEPQNAAGMNVIGQFRDLDDPDRFVWFRSFPDMEQRKEALMSFYGGPVWKAHRDTANATMIDSDNVLLLRFVDPLSGFQSRQSTSPYELTVYSFDASISLESNGMTLLRSETAENTFSALPVRTGENVLVAFSSAEKHVPLPLKRQQHLRLEPTSGSQLV